MRGKLKIRKKSVIQINQRMKKMKTRIQIKTQKKQIKRFKK